MAEPTYTPTSVVGLADGRLISFELCECGALVGDKFSHSRFHSVLSSHGWALAVLKTAHIAAHVHDEYDVPERIDSKHFDNWSADALAQVVSEMDACAVDEPGDFEDDWNEPVGSGMTPTDRHYPGVDGSDPDDHGIVRRLP